MSYNTDKPLAQGVVVEARGQKRPAEDVADDAGGGGEGGEGADASAYVSRSLGSEYRSRGDWDDDEDEADAPYVTRSLGDLGASAYRSLGGEHCSEADVDAEEDALADEELLAALCGYMGAAAAVA